ncbi:MAG: DUF4458 domain-containing protein [Candidatus Cryptobacteroides sp.]
MKPLVKLAVAALTLILTSCAAEPVLDGTATDYGYVQFKLYKDASYEPSTKSIKSELDYLREAYKVKVTLMSGNITFAQTLTLSASSDEAAEFGLRAEKLKLLAGDYDVVTFSLYDKLDELIYEGAAPEDATFKVVEGGLTVKDLTVSVTPRGKVRFVFVKDMSSFTDNPATKAAEREYTFDEVKYVDLTLKIGARKKTYEKLPVSFSQDFAGDPDRFGYRTSVLTCDSLLTMEAAVYDLVSYSTFDSYKSLLETNSDPSETSFEVKDNLTEDVSIPVSLHESDEYIKDYYALYEIWKALDGEHWYYSGEDFPTGANWNFNKDPDLWGDQPGVKLHTNGRVALINISDFGFRGAIPPAIGQLTELVELYLGTHNDVNLLEYDPTVVPGSNSVNRMERHKEYLDMIHPATQMSEPIARALKEKGISIPEIALYDKYSESDLIDKKTGAQKQIVEMDLVYGKLCNGLTAIDHAIGNLKKLETLYIANGELSSLPDEFEQLESLTDFELYNCPKMSSFPMVLARMPNLVMLNLSNNKQWGSSADEGFLALAKGPSCEKIQILYFRENTLTRFPKELANMKKLGMLDLAYNQIVEVEAPGKDFAPVQLYLDHNKITSIPVDENGWFCAIEDVETLSFSYNKLTEVPDIFSSKSVYIMGTVDFSFNDISGFQNEGNGYRGLNVNTLTLANNPKITKFPKCLAESSSIVSYINLRACSIDEIPEGSFKGENVVNLVSLDLSYNNLSDLPKELNAANLPYLYGLELSYNCFSKFPWEPLDCAYLTVFAIRGQRDAEGRRCLREWPTGLYNHKGLRGFYIGSNDLRTINDTISTLIYFLEISDNPNIVFDASDICYAYRVGAYYLIYDKTQNIINCDYMLQ